jgi:hypothetical protein
VAGGSRLWLSGAAGGQHHQGSVDVRAFDSSGLPDGPADPFVARRPPVESTAMATPRPIPPDQIKPPSISIGIQEGRGGTVPTPAPPPPPQEHK